MPFQFNAIARLGGQTSAVGFSGSTGWGETPATLTIIAPADAFKTLKGQVNKLTIEQEGGALLTFEDVRTVSIEEAEPSGAGLLKITVEDRRWRWQFGTIDGDYNVVKDDGTLLREKTPRQLAQLLANAMGERRLNVRNLPNSSRPRKTWRGSSPINELSALCRDLGCVICFNGHQDRPSIERVGVGDRIPQQPVISESRGVRIPAWPSSIIIDTSPTLFQHGLEFFEAVGMDTDGKVKPIDQLSYRPADGWGVTDPLDWIDIDAQYISGGELVNARDLATATVWKWYRLTGLRGGGWVPDELQREQGAPRPAGRDDIGPFLDSRLERDFATNTRLPSVAIGAYYDARENFENTKPGGKIPIDFSIDDATKCIRFSEPVYLFYPDEAVKFRPAQVTIYAGFSVSEQGVPVRYKRTLGLGRAFGAGPRVELRDEIVREIIEQAPFGGAAKDNKAEVDSECDAILTAIESTYQEFSTANPTVPYLGNFTCDGVLRSIAWEASSTDAVTTQLAYNGELNEYIPDFLDTPQARAKREADQAARQRQAIQNGQLRPAPVA